MKAMIRQLFLEPRSPSLLPCRTCIIIVMLFGETRAAACAPTAMVDLAVDVGHGCVLRRIQRTGRRRPRVRAR